MKETGSPIVDCGKAQQRYIRMAVGRGRILLVTCEYVVIGILRTCENSTLTHDTTLRRKLESDVVLPKAEMVWYFVTHISSIASL